MSRSTLSNAAAAIAAAGGVSALLLLTPAADDLTTPVLAQTAPRCDLTQYHAVSGLTATADHVASLEELR